MFNKIRKLPTTELLVMIPMVSTIWVAFSTILGG
jgi:uncharacterized membrane protein